MKTTRIGSLILASVLLLLVACNKKKSSSAGAGYIPKDASMVLSVNGQQLMDKLAREGVTYTRIFEFMNLGKTDSMVPATEFYPALKEWGLDFSKPVQIAVHAPVPPSTKGIVRVVVALSDAEKFSTMLPKEEASVKKDGKITYAVMDEAALGFDKNTAIYVAAINDFSGSTPVYIMNDSTPPSRQEADFTGEQAKALVEKSFSLKNDESMAVTENFDEMPIGNNDARLWMNTDALMQSGMSEELQIAADAMRKFFTGSSVATALNFDKGKITSTSRMYFSKEAAAAIKKAPVKNIDWSLLDKYTGEKPDAIMGIALDPATIKDVLEFSELNGSVNAVLSMAKLSLDDLLSATSGEAVMVMSGLGKAATLSKDEIAISAGAGPNAQVSLIVKLNQPAALEKILSNPILASEITKTGNRYSMGADGQTLYIDIQDKLALISNQPGFAAQYQSGSAGANTLSADLKNRAKDKAAAFYMNMDNLGKSLNGGVTAAMLGDVFGNLFKEMFMSSGRFTGNYCQSEGEIIMGDAQTNSLAGFFKTVVTAMSRQRAMLEQMEMPSEDRIEPMKVD